MKYILDDLGYIDEISFGGTIECKNKTCTEYTGTIPSGYTSLIEWSEKANTRAYKITNGNLVYDSAKNTALQTQWTTEEENSKISNYISSKGSNSNGSWIKYVDGTMVTYQRYKATLASTPDEWGSLYAYSITNIKNYPQTFKELPTISATLSATGKNGWLCTNVETGEETASKPCGYQLIRPTKTTLENVYLNVVAYGRWK